ncbi:MAG TPA: hypothetical protein VD948_08765 [Rhodothermales bacterium]|nr:hypothetical protein [Rhodothermales bacterium]
MGAASAKEAVLRKRPATILLFQKEGWELWRRDYVSRDRSPVSIWIVKGPNVSRSFADPNEAIAVIPNHG